MSSSTDAAPAVTEVNAAPAEVNAPAVESSSVAPRLSDSNDEKPRPSVDSDDVGIVKTQPKGTGTLTITGKNEAGEDVEETVKVSGCACCAMCLCAIITCPCTTLFACFAPLCCKSQTKEAKAAKKEQTVD